MTTTVAGKRFGVRYRGGTATVCEWRNENHGLLVLFLGPPHGDDLARMVADRLNSLGELSIQAIEVEGDPHAFDKLALKFLNEGLSDV
jgi:hypothetical protein